MHCLAVAGPRTLLKAKRVNIRSSLRSTFDEVPRGSQQTADAFRNPEEQVREKSFQLSWHLRVHSMQVKTCDDPIRRQQQDQKALAPARCRGEHRQAEYSTKPTSCFPVRAIRGAVYKWTLPGRINTHEHEYCAFLPATSCVRISNRCSDLRHVRVVMHNALSQSGLSV